MSSDSDVEQIASGLNPEIEAKAGASDPCSSELSLYSDHPSCDIITASAVSKPSETVDISDKGSVKQSLLSFDDGNKKEMPIVSKTKAQFTGKLATKKRNQRRRDNTRLKRLKSRGVLLPNATIADYHRLQENGATAKEPPGERREKPQEEAGDTQTNFETKKEYLLKALASGGIDASHKSQKESSSSQEMGSRATVEETVLDDGSMMLVDERARISDDLQRNHRTDQTQSSPNKKPTPPKKGTGLLGRISNSVDEIAAPLDDVKTAADRITIPDEIEVSSNGISASLLETVIETNQTTGPQNLDPHKRSRLDIPSSKRLVFGSLGVRVPKTKEDEAKLMADLMKDVRPLQASRTNEASKVSELSIARSNDSWKDKIMLMAVECCEEGVELSTPPFPFVQRWDPQQRKPFKGGNNSHRGKKRKRGDDQQHVKAFSEGANEDMFDWGGSASFDLENSAAGELMGSHSEPQDRRASATANDEYEIVPTEKVQCKPDDSVPASADGGSIEDLPSLPEDISTCLPLTELIALPGAIIAFKQLDMSEKTNWQPIISEYRTGKVDCLTDNGMLRMKLAKRDQSNKEEHFDEHTGKRFYSKFEMPGFDDDHEDPGVLEISFSELIEPKLIQAAIFKSAMQQPSFDEFHCPPDTDTVMENNFESSPAGPKPRDPESPEAVHSESRMAGANEGVRQEIFDLIKEAGWRSSIRSGDEDDERSQQNSSTSQNQPLLQDQLASQDAVYRGDREETNPNQYPSEQSNGFNSSPPRENLSESPNQRSSERSIAESTQSSRVSEIPETVPVHRSTIPNTPTKNAFVNSDEVVDVKDEDYEQGLGWSEPQFQTEADHQMSSQELSSPKPPPSSFIGPVQPEGLIAKIMSSPGPPTSPHEISSDNEFPTLENIFSQVRSSQVRSSQVRSSRSSQAISRQARPSFEPRASDDDLTYMAKSSFGSTTTKERGSQKDMSQKSESSGEYNLAGKETLFKWEVSDEGDRSTPRASQRTVQPQIVDLTLPSDPADAPGDSDYIDDGTQLPTGPGWVKKTRATSSRLGSMKPGEGRSMRSRSRSVY